MNADVRTDSRLHINDSLDTWSCYLLFTFFHIFGLTKQLHYQHLTIAVWKLQLIMTFLRWNIRKILQHTLCFHISDVFCLKVTVSANSDLYNFHIPCFHFLSLFWIPPVYCIKCSLWDIIQVSTIIGCTYIRWYLIVFCLSFKSNWILNFYSEVQVRLRVKSLLLEILLFAISTNEVVAPNITIKSCVRNESGT